MARIEWIKYRLDNWALWKARESAGGLGYATQSVLLSEVVDRYREIPLPVDDVDGEQTNQAVESLKVARSHLYITLQLIYVKGVGIKGAASHAGCAISTIHDRLDQADRALSQWFGERAERQKISAMRAYAPLDAWDRSQSAKKFRNS